MTVCAACDRAIHQPDDTHYWHHLGCPNRDYLNATDVFDCTCDLRYHAECCPRPDCQPTAEGTAK